MQYKRTKKKIRSRQVRTGLLICRAAADRKHCSRFPAGVLTGSGFQYTIRWRNVIETAVERAGAGGGNTEVSAQVDNEKLEHFVNLKKEPRA